jgi:hypothetical protein
MALHFGQHQQVQFHRLPRGFLYFSTCNFFSATAHTLALLGRQEEKISISFTPLLMLTASRFTVCAVHLSTGETPVRHRAVFALKYSMQRAEVQCDEPNVRARVAMASHQRQGEIHMFNPSLPFCILKRHSSDDRNNQEPRARPARPSIIFHECSHRPKVCSQ